MKRLFLTVALLLACVYMLPVFTVGLESAGQADDGTSGGESPSAGGDFDQSTVITLCDGGEVKELKLCDYLKGVLAAEMPASFPIEALKAQAVAARTYTLYQLSLYDSGMEAPESHNGAQLCSDYTHCKAYRDVDAQKESLWGSDADFYYDKIKSAVDDTSGIIATYKGEPIAAVFHAASSEMTESSLSVWGTEMPYLVSVESPGGEESPKYNGTVEISAEDFKSKMLESYRKWIFPRLLISGSRPLSVQKLAGWKRLLSAECASAESGSGSSWDLILPILPMKFLEIHCAFRQKAMATA